MNNFGHIEDMKVRFISKYSKFYVDFENVIKLGEHIDGFEDNCVWTCCGTFSQLWREYMWRSVNVLKSSAKILDPTKRHDNQLYLFDINGTLA